MVWYTTADSISDPMWTNWITTTSNITITIRTSDPWETQLWVRWNDYGTATNSTSNIVVGNYRAPVITEEERVRRAEVAARQEELRLEIEKQKVDAEAKAKETLFSLLNEEQRQQYEQFKQFFITANDGTQYLIKREIGDNIIRYEKREGEEIAKPTEVLCAHFPSGYGDLPVEDVLTSQVLYFLSGQEKQLYDLAHKRRAS